MRSSNAPVLLVEDNPSEVLLMRRAWAKAGVRCPLVTAHDGNEALEYLQNSGHYGARRSSVFPALVLADLNMPGRNGFDLLHWIRCESDTPTLVVIILTASELSSDITTAYALGANAFLRKPGTWHGLVELLKDLDHFWLKWPSLPEPFPVPEGRTFLVRNRASATLTTTYR